MAPRSSDHRTERESTFASSDDTWEDRDTTPTTAHTPNSTTRTRLTIVSTRKVPTCRRRRAVPRTAGSGESAVGGWFIDTC